MVITVICDVLGEANNGTSLAAYNLINSLKEKGHTVRVVCPDKDKEGLPGYYILPTISFGSIIDKIIAKNNVVLCKGDLKVIDAACHDADAVHCLLGFSAGKAAAKYCFERNIPVTAGFHCQSQNFAAHVCALHNPIVNRLVYRFLSNGFYKYVDATHFPTQFIKDEADRFNMLTGKAYVISNGVKTSIFHPHKVEKPSEWKDKFIITMSGRYSKEKYQKTLIKAMKYSKHEKDIQLVFAGKGPLLNNLKRRARKLTNAPHFESYTHKGLSDLLCMTDLYCHTSYAEIEAISALEALACGCVPVISDSKESATSKFSLCEQSTYNFPSPKSLAARIDYWFEHPEEKAIWSKKYAEFGKQFNYDDCMARMERMIVENAKAKRRAEFESIVEEAQAKHRQT